MVASAAAAVGGSVRTAGEAGLRHRAKDTVNSNKVIRYYPIGYAPTSPSTPVIIVALPAHKIL
jgi:hypothetical protein